MACKSFYILFLLDSHPYLPGRFRWADCQLKYLANCNPAHIRHALDTLPATLDETYERTMREIKEEKWEDARRLLLCVAVASRPLRVGELAEILAFNFEAGSIPKFCEDARLQNPIEAVLTTCSTLLSVVEDWRSQVVQFAHFTVKEFLTLDRLAKKGDAIFRYHISMIDAHTLLAQACLGILLHLDKDITRDGLTNFPFAQYAAEHWLDHAHFEGVSQNVIGGMTQLFDRRKHHLVVWLWIYDPTVSPFQRDKSAKVPLPLSGTPLHYAAFCGLHHVVETLTMENSQDVNSRSFDNESTPLHLASREGHGHIARILFEHRADTEARTKDGETPLHLASQRNHVELARFLLEHGANTETWTKDGETLLHWASSRGHVELSQLLLEHRANVAAQTKDGETPLHLASQLNHVELVQLLLKHQADVAAQTKDGETPLHLASQHNHVQLPQLLLEHGADVAARTKDQETPLHLASDCGHLELARLLFKHGADVAAQTKDGVTPLHLASDWGHIALAQLLFEHGADVAAETKDGETPLHWASHRGHVELARLLLEHNANVTAQTKDGETPLHWASDWGDVKLARLLLEYGADAAAKTNNGSTPLQRASYWGHVELVGALYVASMQAQQPAPI
jgi:ankyrin repeat protein